MNKTLWLLPVLPVLAVMFFLTRPTEKFEEVPFVVENWEAPAPQPEVQTAPTEQTVSQEATAEESVQTVNSSTQEVPVDESETVSSAQLQIPEDPQQTSAVSQEVASLGNS